MEDVRQAAVEALAAAGLLADGWHVAACRRRSGTTVELALDPPASAAGDRGIGLDWSEPRDSGLKAFRSGDVYACSYRKSPRAWDIDDEGTPSAIRDRAYKACETLANLPRGIVIYEMSAAQMSEAPASGAPAPLPPVEPPPDGLPKETIDALVAGVGYSLPRELGTDLLPNPEGWVFVDTRPFLLWMRIAEARIKLADDHTLTFILYPHNDRQPCFRRTEHFDLVYYSDDIPIDRHDELYARDTAMIERFSDWFEAWDKRGGGPRGE